MPRARLPQLHSITDGSFEPNRKNPILLGEDSFLDDHQKPIRIGESASPLSLSKSQVRINGNFYLEGSLSNPLLSTDFDYLEFRPKIYTRFTSSDFTGSLDLYVSSGDAYFVTSGDEYSFLTPSTGVFKYGTVDGVLNQVQFDCNLNQFTFSHSSSASTLFRIDLESDGETKLETSHSSGTSANLILDVAGDITLDSATGNFIAKKGGTEFSSANSAYAGMILGYTCLRNLDTGTGNETITINTTMTVLQTDQGNDVKVTFVAPPSGNVEIVFSALVDASSKIIRFALSDNATFNEINAIHTYDNKCVTIDESDEYVNNIRWYITGLTAGSSYTYFIAAKANSNYAYIYHGINRFSAHSPPITVKAIALPATNYTGE